MRNVTVETYWNIQTVTYYRINQLKCSKNILQYKSIEMCEHITVQTCWNVQNWNMVQYKPIEISKAMKHVTVNVTVQAYWNFQKYEQVTVQIYNVQNCD